LERDAGRSWRGSHSVARPARVVKNLFEPYLGAIVKSRTETNWHVFHSNWNAHQRGTLYTTKVFSTFPESDPTTGEQKDNESACTL
jgi:hypothetical protein